MFGLFAASQVFAAAVDGCVDGVAQLIPTTGNFLKQPIAPKCSANVNLVVDENTTLGFAVASSSNRGKFMFSGNTGGGSVSSAGQCPTLPCTKGQLSTPLAAAVLVAT